MTATIRCPSHASVFGENAPFSVVDSWSNLPELVSDLLINWDEKSAQIATWWSAYKNRLVAALENEITELRRVG